MAPKGRFKQSFAVPRDDLWDALTACLPTVTTRAAFYEATHRVEWTIDTTGFMWAQTMSASADEGPDNTSVLAMTGRTRYWPSMLAPGARARTHRTLAAAINAYLANPPARKPAPRTGGDYFRTWNGQEWSVEPPPA